MAKITWQVPLLQYGKFVIEADEDELGVDVSSPHSLGMAYAVFAQLAAKGYDEGLKIQVDAFIGAPTPDVTGQYQESSESKRPTREQIMTEMSDGDHDTEASAERALKDQLGATTVEPWTKTPAPTTTPKAWDDFNVEEF